MHSWLSKIVGQPRRAETPDFGKLTYMGGYWEGAGIFPPTLSEVEYFVIAGDLGPSDANQRAFQVICSNYAELLEKAAAVISNGSKITVKASELNVSSLDVPAGDLHAENWEMSFSRPDGASFAVEYRGLDATGTVDVSY